MNPLHPDTIIERAYIARLECGHFIAPPNSGHYLAGPPAPGKYKWCVRCESRQRVMDVVARGTTRINQMEEGS